MILDRREFLAAATGMALSACAAARRTSAPLRVLMLGGTNYVGHALVQESIERGHQVTIFNRGQTNPHFFPDVEKLRGDRVRSQGEALAALRGRDWDVVLDTWSTAPAAVAVAAERLRGHVGHYLFVSSIAVYGSFRDVGIDETARTVRTSQITDAWSETIPYPVAKRKAEEHVQEQFERHTILRATSINGFDPSRRPSNQQVYWPIRMDHGGAVLAPGDGLDPFQYIDVKDLASFALAAAERDLRGIFNAVGPRMPIGFGTYLDTLRQVGGPRATLTWVPADFLQRMGVLPFEHLPSWIPSNDPEPGFFQISNARAVRNGLSFRPLADTVRDVYASYDVQALEPDVAGGLSRRRELEVLTEWAQLSQKTEG